MARLSYSAEGAYSTEGGSATVAPGRDDPFIAAVRDKPIEQERYRTLKTTLAEFAATFQNKSVLDFGCSYGLSACALRELGAKDVTGIEPDEPRVVLGNEIIQKIGYSDEIRLQYVEDTTVLPFEDEAFDVVLANAVFEHIPQPRDQHFKEVWRVLRKGGYFLLNETPNKYLPVDFHTLHLPLTNWLPSSWAHWVGTKTGKFPSERTDWDYSGWRGLGYWEMMRALGEGAKMHHESTRNRHKVFRAVGLPASLLDPYPSYIVQKEG